jgi:hypothetical protein
MGFEHFHGLDVDVAVGDQGIVSRPQYGGILSGVAMIAAL